MKKLAALALVLCLGYDAVQAQDLMIPPPRGRAAKMGLLGGFTPGYLSLDLAPINAMLKSSGIAPFDQKGAFMWGGAGAAYILIVPNLRLGGLGMSGSVSTGSSVNVAGVGAVQRDAKLTVGFGGVTVEYVIPIAGRFDFAFGTMLGAGGIDLDLRQSVGGVDSWTNEGKIFSAWPPSPLNNSTRTLSGSYFVWVPSASFEYAVLGLLAFRVGVSYVGMSFPSWSVDSNYDLKDVPSGVSGKGFMVNAGILVGTF